MPAKAGIHAVTISGETKVFDKPSDSGNMIGRVFCPTCGSIVYATNSAAPQALFLRASSLDDPEGFQPQMVVFTASGPSWDTLDPALPQFEAMPPGAAEMFAGGT